MGGWSKVQQNAVKCFIGNGQVDGCDLVLQDGCELKLSRGQPTPGRLPTFSSMFDWKLLPALMCDLNAGSLMRDASVFALHLMKKLSKEEGLIAHFFRN